MKIRSCIVCGTIVESKYGNKLYCDSHRILTDRLHLKTWWAKNKDRINEERRINHIKKDRIIQCKICGIDVVATGSKQCFCAFHAHQTQLKNSKEWHKRHIDKKREKDRRYASRQPRPAL